MEDKIKSKPPWLVFPLSKYWLETWSKNPQVEIQVGVNISGEQISDGKWWSRNIWGLILTTGGQKDESFPRGVVGVVWQLGDFFARLFVCFTSATGIPLAPLKSKFQHWCVCVTWDFSQHRSVPQCDYSSQHKPPQPSSLTLGELWTLDPLVCTGRTIQVYPCTYVTRALECIRAKVPKKRWGRCLIGTLFDVKLICSL